MNSESLQADIDYFRSLPRHKMDKELSGCERIYLRDLARQLGIPVRFESGELKNKAVLVAAIYEQIVTAN